MTACPLFRIEVTGASMSPALEPGDRVLAARVPRWGARRLLREGQVVIGRDPRDPENRIIKRISRADSRTVEVLGDNPSASTDSRAFGPVEHRLIEGIVVRRYRRGP